MKFFQRKKKHIYKPLSVQKYKQAHTMRMKRKRVRLSKVFFDSIKTKFLLKYKKIIIIFTVVIVVGGNIGIIFFSSFFNVKNIFVERTNIITDTIPIQQFLIEKYKDQNLLFVNAADIKKEIEKNFPEMKEIDIYKLYPRTLRVKVVEYPIIARISSFNDEKELHINENGIIRDCQTGNENLPLIKYKTQYELADNTLFSLLSPYLTIKNRNKIMKAEEVKNILNAQSSFENKFNIPVVFVKYYPLEREVHLKTDKGFSVWIDIMDDTEKQLEKLQKTLSVFNIHQISLSYIDLRIAQKIIYCKKESRCAVYDKE